MQYNVEVLKRIAKEMGLDWDNSATSFNIGSTEYTGEMLQTLFSVGVEQTITLSLLENSEGKSIAFSSKETALAAA